MKFVRVSKVAEKLNMDVAVVSEMVQKKLFDKEVYWRGCQSDEITKYDGSFEHYNDYSGGLVFILRGNEISYASEDYCRGQYTEYFCTDNVIKIKVKDFDIIYNNTVELSGEYTKEQLQEILNNMEE